ncbi:MAG TPA: hypothetical protein VMF59_02980 [Bacteroidota bacterium]|nr:hypothetical protein [Bacteroidota bacterium]
MNVSVCFSLLCLSLLRSGNVRAQMIREDVVVLKDSTIIRGAITETATPGSPVLIHRADGRVKAVLWSEVLTIRRLPVNMPDSMVSVLYLRTEPGSEGVPVSVTPIPGGYSSIFGPAANDAGEEDVLLLEGGNIVRGDVIDILNPEALGLWTAGGTLRTFWKSDIVKSLRVPGGTSDSTIDVLYLHPLPEMIADDFRVLTLFGGLSLPGGDFAAPRSEGGDPLQAGFAGGVHASIRLSPMTRWATTVIYGSNMMRLPEAATYYTASGSPGSHRLLWFLTGDEVRIEGTAALKAFAFVQVGWVFSHFRKFEFTVPLTFNHPAGTGVQEGASSNGRAVCLGGGVSMGRISLSARWLSSKVRYDYRTTINFTDYGPFAWEYAYDQPVNVFLVSVGFSPF